MVAIRLVEEHNHGKWGYLQQYFLKPKPPAHEHQEQGTKEG